MCRELFIHNEETGEEVPNEEIIEENEEDKQN